MFYVLYSPSADQYIDVEGCYCNFVNAERFSKPDGDTLYHVKQSSTDDIRWVGPCNEGEEP